MDTQKLHDLIDKVIGKDGPLRTPAYWMRRVLKDMVNNITELKTWVGDAMLSLEAKVKVLLANYIKSIPEFTYAELENLKNKNLLIPGQKYRMTDYECTVSDYPDGLDGSYKLPKNQDYRHVFLTALTTSEFDKKALCVRPSYVDDPKYSREIQYCFARNEMYGWCLKGSEGFTIKVKKDSSETTLILKYSRPVQLDGVYRSLYVTEDGADYGYIAVDIKKAFKEGRAIVITDANKTSLGQYYVLDIIDDSFKGVIYESKNSILNITLPCDECILFSFDVTTPVKTYSVSDEPLAIISSSLNGTRNIHIRPYMKVDIVCLPRIYISGGVSSSQSSSTNSIYIADNSTNIIVRGSNCHIGRGCSNIYLYSCSHAILEPSVNSVEIVNKSYVRIDPHCSNLLVQGEGDAILGAFNKNLKIRSSSAIDIASNVYQDNAETVIIDTSQKGAKLFVSKDSNGNIRQWNPADFVDAVAPEEQTTETTDE